MFDNNFGKCEPISKFFHHSIRRKILYVYAVSAPLPKLRENTQTFTKLDNPLTAELWPKTIFKMAAIRHLEF